ncbi:DUF4355 domain-containing protein [Lysinibacillus sp. FSL M8-0216]|uniref:capsid assembly scaffolding protein Gp46 family protein n=1 Tax=Lysinibacillus sp. FSL M8-0216 TaxID=2921619 RepID=UPI00315A333E
MKKIFYDLLKLDLQYFAEETQTTETSTESEQQEETKTLTMEDVQKLIQSETDKIRTEYSKKLKDKDEELEKFKIDKMSEEELKAHEIEQIKLENEALKQEKLGFFVQSELVKQSIALEATELIIGNDEEDIVKKVTVLKQIIDNAVTVKASELYREKGTEHKQGTDKVGSMSKAEFNALSLKERTELFDTNPTLYNELRK